MSANNNNDQRQKKTDEGESKCGQICRFIYNSKTGLILGRTFGSWLKIIGFYLVYYAFLVGFWAACLAIFMSIMINPDEPVWYGKGTIIGDKPGMGYQPWLKDSPDSTLIKFNSNDTDSYEKYVDQIEAFLQRYNSTEHTRACTADQSNNDTDVDLSCRFRVSDLENSELCSPANDYGFKDGKPCIIITLNRMIGWIPEKYESDERPKELKGRGSNGDIAIDCKGEYEADQENLGTLTYVPPNGFSRKFYPYRKSKQYHQPVAFVKFDSLPVGIAVEVECRAYAKNIVYDRLNRLGMTNFVLLLDGK